MQQNIITIGSMGFECLVAGDEGRPLVIMMHNFLLTNQQWREHIPALAQAGFRVLAPNMRGVSPQARPEQQLAYSNDEMIGDILALAEHEGVEKFHLVTHGWSSIIGWHLAATQPDVLHSFTAVSTPHPVALNLALDDEASAQVDMLAKIANFCSNNASVRLLANDAQILREYYQASGVSEVSAEMYLTRYGRAEAIQAFLHWHTLQLDELGQEIAKVQVPTLYMWGEEDPLFSVEAAKHCHHGVSAEFNYEAFEKVGHMVGEQMPERFTTKLLAHLGGQQESA
ncbi:pimeloyl-ACP methyl ester carboxylesterase [Sinobacterium caligoides]|uniref:Pimeloyl-ACP methyl ester carboxylesterase n=1 Tax=Sinobacterium caligoides TaxID=933926 RepID=A0A3N2DZA1_9GAMM|nr:alpha/beta hydrolase [Sinobacterium caligoides]ROS05201.1 pimeloyl-ACP methyl ester carboxylesterase [Sinobacterium caligoides]